MEKLRKNGNVFFTCNPYMLKTTIFYIFSFSTLYGGNLIISICSISGFSPPGHLVVILRHKEIYQKRVFFRHKREMVMGKNLLSPPI